MKVSTHYMLIGKDGRIAYDRWHEVEVSNGQVFITKFHESLQINEGDQLIGEMHFEVRDNNSESPRG